MHSAEQNLATQRLTYVMLTRVRDDVEIFTNDRDRLLSTISHNPGDKLSALETTGEKTPIDRIDPSRAGTFSPTIPASVLDGSSPKVNFPTHGVEGLSPGKAAEVAAPAPAKELKFPERNIERSR